MFLSKIFGTKSDREIKKLSPIINQINQFYESLSSKTDEELVDKTRDLIKQYEKQYSDGLITQGEK